VIELERDVSHFAGVLRRRQFFTENDARVTHYTDWCPYIHTDAGPYIPSCDYHAAQTR